MSSSYVSSDLLRFLKQPESYSHRPDHVDHIQTHISHVFIASPYVYKIKKPVDFGFLDYSSLEQRKYFCEREVELNRRLCAEIYLGVMPISRKNRSFGFDPEKQGSIIEYAVFMKKLSEEYLLSEQVNNATLTTEQLNRVADKLAIFYQNQSPGPEILKWGEAERIKTNTDENFQQTEPFIGDTIDKSVYDAIQHYTNGYLMHHAALFQKRIEEQRIVDGHGDLHLQHIHVTPDRICIYDCIEFNERFRYQDLAGDLAYLAMDLDFHGLWKSGGYFIQKMTEKLNDPGLKPIIDFYKCYRAYVKGKVKSLQSNEEEVSEEDRNQAKKLAVSYFDLSLKYALLGSQPYVLIFMGPPGSGKSTLARKASDRLNLALYSSDIIRKKMAGLPPDERSPASKRNQLYSAKMSAKTYNRLWQKAFEQVQKGHGVVLDATFSNRSDRKDFISQLESNGVGYYFIETRAPVDVLKKRLEEREYQQDIISDARLEDFEMLHRRYDSPEEIGSHHLIHVDTYQTLDDSLYQLYLQLAGTNLKQVNLE